MTLQNKTVWRLLFLGMLVLLCLPPSAAMAADAVEVWVNNVQLSASSPYWKNGNEPASESDWNAHFDAATATLTLQDAQINTLHTVSSSYAALIYAEGDLTLNLDGSNTLQYTTGSGSGNINAIYIRSGSVSVTGSGQLDIQMDIDGTGSSRGIYAERDITIQSGIINIRMVHDVVLYGIDAYGNLLISGGTISITGQADLYSGLGAGGDYFRMTGGSVEVDVRGDIVANGIEATEVFLEGGTGSFLASGAPYGSYGIRVEDNTLNVLGPQFVVYGARAAIYFRLYHGGSPTYNLLNSYYIVVSENAGYEECKLWHSEADGILGTSRYGNSSFRYVEFTDVLPDCLRAAPQTGDDSAPLLWAGIALLMIAVAMAYSRAMKRRHEYGKDRM